MWNLEDFIKVFLRATAVLEDFVLVAGELEASFLALYAYDGDVGEFYLVGGLRWGVSWRQR